MKNKQKNKGWLFLGLSIILAVLCMFLPGTIVSIQANNNMAVVHQAAGTYSYSEGQNVVRMTLYERMKLISGEWESQWQLVDQQTVRPMSEVPEEMLEKVIANQAGENQLDGYCYLDYQSVLDCAEEGLKELYEAGIYPEDAESTYNNWYRPTVSLYQFSDSVFDSYSCYVWLVELDYYDGSLTHTLLIDDTTGAILAAGVKGDSYTLDPSWIQGMNNQEKLGGLILEYYRTSQKIYGVLDITGVDVYQPRYGLWDTAYGLTDAQINGNTPGVAEHQLLLSSDNNISSYEAAVKEVKDIVDNDKFIYTVYWSNRQCWFYLSPFTIRLERE